MTVDPLDRLRAVNPVPHGSSAPPLAQILERILDEGRPAHRRRLWAGSIVPAVGVAAVIAVVALALVLLGHRAAATHSTPAAPTVSGTPAAPVGGMGGVVEVYGSAFSSPERGVISLQQCQPCHAAPTGGQQTFSDWLASTSDGGASWQVTRRPWYLFDPRFSGSDGWAEGLQAPSGGGGLARFYVSHDGGRSWSVAPSAAPALGNENVSVAGGEVWAVGSGCQATCNVTVLRGPASGTRLSATPAQPIAGGYTNLQAVAAGPGTAYVTNSVDPAQSFATHDNGRTWQRLSPPCPAGAAVGELSAGGPVSLWETCQMRRGADALRRSTDGGRHWQALPASVGNLFTLQAGSAQVAWALTVHGDVIRTADGGRSWSTVWTVGLSQPSALAGHTPMLSQQGPLTAAVLVILSRGHVQHHSKFTNLVVYRTTNGGQSWQPSVVRLPAGAR
jgi:hypothetical protein